MKKLFILTLVCTMTLSVSNVYAQMTNPSLAVISIDNDDETLTPAQLASIARVEMIKTGKFEVLDPYDLQYLLDQNDFDATNCYGKICLIEAGKILGVDKILSGSVESFEHVIVVTLRQLDVNTGKIENSTAKEFQKIPNQVGSMITIAVQEMYGLEMDKAILTKLTKKDDFESTVNVTDIDVLNLTGPRMGVTFFSGEIARVYRLPKSEGGFDAMPFMTQFGYQFEVKYLNEGSVQALFEFIPIITGLDQGRVIPSLTVLSGIRSNVNGFEFAFGPNIFVSQQAEGFYMDPESKDNFVIDGHGFDPEIHEKVLRLDSRGDFRLGSGFVLAVGKTFRSGKLNIPVNAFFIPGKRSSHRFGISFGFNMQKS